jgi:hypothetical protein
MKMKDGTFAPRRLLIAVALALGIYGIALGAGSLLYVTGVIAIGPTHNDCEGYREEIARERGIKEEDVPQSEIRARTAACLDGHKLSEQQAFREEYLMWAAWPAVVVAVIYLFWPAWARALERQDEDEAAAGEPVH